MVMSWIFTFLIFLSCFSALVTGQGSALAPALLSGAQAGITLAISIGGSIILWTGIGVLLEHAGILDRIRRLLSPLLKRLFPGTRQDPLLAGAVSANICANFLGLGNAATPMGIRAIKRMAQNKDTASDEMCRLIVLNTASIQLIPSNVAALRASFGCVQPFDILPMVWITSFLSASAGLLAAFILGKMWCHD